VTDLLRDTDTRLRWAREALDALKEEIRQWRDGEPYSLRGEVDSDSGAYRVTVEPEPVADVVKRCVTVCVQHLRITLDYLVYALSILDDRAFLKCKANKRVPQFPIEDTPQMFSKREKTWLKFLTPTHQAVIESAQPYKGTQWAATIRDLADPDKHRAIVPVGSLIEGDMKPLRVARAQRLDVGASARLGVARPGMMRLGHPGGQEQASTYLSPTDPFASKDVNVQIGITFHVAFEDGSPVIHTLEILESEVSALVQLFRPDF
jgi:hypothetical protein